MTIVDTEGRDPIDVRRMLREAADKIALPELPPLRAGIRRLERERMREKVRGTIAIRTKVLGVLTEWRKRFFHASGLTALREAEGEFETPINESGLELGLHQITPDLITEALGPELAELYRSGRESAGVELRMLADVWSVPQTRSLVALDKHVLEFANRAANRERAAIKALIRAAIEQGLGTRELERMLTEFFADGVHLEDVAGESRVLPSDAWAEAVARTETSRAHNAGIMDLYAQAGIEYVMWLAAEDERTCPLCLELDRRIVRLGEAFIEGVDAPPAHVLCRCTVVSVAAAEAGEPDPTPQDDEAEAA